MDEKAHHRELMSTLEALAYTIHRIACEVNQRKLLTRKYTQKERFIYD